MQNVDRIIDGIIEREGREFTNHSEDRGGPTKFGVTLATLSRWRQRPCGPDDVAALQEGEAREILRSLYVFEPGFHKVRDPYVLVLAVDCGVNHGPKRAIRWLQRAAGVIDDGVIGPVTEVAVNTIDPVRLYQRLLSRRVRFYGQIIADDPERLRASRDGYKLQARFAEGWLNRAAEFIEEAAV